MAAPHLRRRRGLPVPHGAAADSLEMVTYESGQYRSLPGWATKKHPPWDFLLPTDHPPVYRALRDEWV